MKYHVSLAVEYAQLYARYIFKAGPQAPGYAMADLFESLGGAPAISAVTETFYRKVLTDDRISHFFDDTDMERQMSKQTAFLTMACGGPNAYSGRDMRSAHAHLVVRGLSDAHVDAVIELLGASCHQARHPEHGRARFQPHPT